MVGFVDFGLLTFILLRDEVQSVLSTPRKPFFYMLSTQFLSTWWNLTTSWFWPIFLTILCMKYSILQNPTSIVDPLLHQFTSSMIKVMGKTLSKELLIMFVLSKSRIPQIIQIFFLLYILIWSCWYLLFSDLKFPFFYIMAPVMIKKQSDCVNCRLWPWKLIFSQAKTDFFEFIWNRSIFDICSSLVQDWFIGYFSYLGVYKLFFFITGKGIQERLGIQTSPS